MKGKDSELAKLRVNVDNVKDDMKREKENHKEMEDKFRYVCIAMVLGSKQQLIFSLVNEMALGHPLLVLLQAGTS